MIRTLLVDDEPLARAALRARLAGEPDLDIVGEAGGGAEAVALVLAERPDLVLLDVQMPEIDGIEVVRRVAGQHLPAVIFVSAHDRFALRAFEVHAVDYLLKPVTAERLATALQRVRVALNAAERPDTAALAALIAEPGGAADAPLRRLLVRERRHALLLRDDEVEWIAAAGNYVEVHARGRSFLRRGTIAELAARLDPALFARIHRSTLVARARVRRITPDPSGDFHVALEGGETLRMSRRYRAALLADASQR